MLRFEPKQIKIKLMREPTGRTISIKASEPLARLTEDDYQPVTSPEEQEVFAYWLTQQSLVSTGRLGFRIPRSGFGDTLIAPWSGPETFFAHGNGEALLKATDPIIQEFFAKNSQGVELAYGYPIHVDREGWVAPLLFCEVELGIAQQGRIAARAVGDPRPRPHIGALLQAGFGRSLAERVMEEIEEQEIVSSEAIMGHIESRYGWKLKEPPVPADGSFVQFRDLEPGWYRTPILFVAPKDLEMGAVRSHAGQIQRAFSAAIGPTALHRALGISRIASQSVSLDPALTFPDSHSEAEVLEQAVSLSLSEMQIPPGTPRREVVKGLVFDDVVAGRSVLFVAHSRRAARKMASEMQSSVAPQQSWIFTEDDTTLGDLIGSFDKPLASQHSPDAAGPSFEDLQSLHEKIASHRVLLMGQGEANPPRDQAIEASARKLEGTSSGSRRPILAHPLPTELADALRTAVMSARKAGPFSRLSGAHKRAKTRLREVVEQSLEWQAAQASVAPTRLSMEDRKSMARLLDHAAILLRDKPGNQPILRNARRDQAPATKAQRTILNVDQLLQVEETRDFFQEHEAIVSHLTSYQNSVVRAAWEDRRNGMSSQDAARHVAALREWSEIERTWDQLEDRDEYFKTEKSMRQAVDAIRYLSKPIPVFCLSLAAVSKLLPLWPELFDRIIVDCPVRLPEQELASLMVRGSGATILVRRSDDTPLARIIKDKRLFPGHPPFSLMLHDVRGCHPAISQYISDTFYDGTLRCDGSKVPIAEIDYAGLHWWDASPGDRGRDEVILDLLGRCLRGLESSGVLTGPKKLSVAVFTPFNRVRQNALDQIKILFGESYDQHMNLKVGGPENLREEVVDIAIMIPGIAESTGAAQADLLCRLPDLVQHGVGAARVGVHVICESAPVQQAGGPLAELLKRSADTVILAQDDQDDIRRLAAIAAAAEVLTAPLPHGLRLSTALGGTYDLLFSDALDDAATETGPPIIPLPRSWLDEAQDRITRLLKSLV